MIVYVLLLILAIGQSSQDPIFLRASTDASNFKGLPELPKFNATAGEARSVYHYEQIVAVIDVLGDKKLLHCELIEVYEPSEVNDLLGNLSATFKTNRISFKDVMKLMDKCDKLDENPSRTLVSADSNVNKPKIGNPLLVGIIPGTKWCGTGDIAKSYHDLGSRSRIDRCCRAHDLCPVKVRAYRNRYSLNNNSFFSKSHCICDETFYKCLKSINHVSANIIGNIYFNIAQPQCIEDDPSSSDANVKRFVSVKRGF